MTVEAERDFQGDPDDVNALLGSYRTNGLAWWPVLIFLPARTAVSLLCQVAVAVLYVARGSAHPWQQSEGWWMVYGTVTDVVCLFLLRSLLRREHLRIRDLLGLGRASLTTQLRTAPLYVLAFIPIVIATTALSRLFYGDALVPQIASIHTPAWAQLYAVTVWPILWGFTEEVVYLGYLLPRFEAMLDRTWLAAGIVVSTWGLQHFVIPFIPDSTYLASRVLTALMVVGGMTLIFLLGKRRIIAAMVVHYLADLASAITVLTLPRR